MFCDMQSIYILYILNILYIEIKHEGYKSFFCTKKSQKKCNLFTKMHSFCSIKSIDSLALECLNSFQIKTTEKLHILLLTDL